MSKLKLTNDFIFKKVFGKQGNESILKDFLEAILKIRIEKIEVEAEVELERELIDDKVGKLDIKAIIDNKTTIDIEMQMEDKYNMAERTLYYWSSLYHTGLKKTEDYRINNRVITINILKYDIFKEGPYHEKIQLRREYKNILLTNKLEIHFIQLTKFLREGNKTENKELWNWLTFICDKDKKELEYLTGDEAVRRMAFLREKAERDYVSNMNGAREEGIELGIKEGEKNKAKEIAKEMLTKGFDISTIAEITKLTKEEVEELKELKEKN